MNERTERDKVRKRATKGKEKKIISIKNKNTHKATIQSDRKILSKEMREFYESKIQCEFYYI